MLFDASLFVDWSARNGPSPRRPCKDAIWIAEAAGDGIVTTYVRTRAEAGEHVARRLRAHVDARRRVLVGFDFPYGYPYGFARAIGARGAAWCATWSAIAALVSDDPGNVSNRFEAAAELNARCGAPAGPFWGHPPGRRYAGLAPTGPGFPVHLSRHHRLERLRLTDRRLPGVQEGWKLFGNGCAGSQALVGIPIVHRLRRDPRLAAHSLVWPFETGFTAPPVTPGRPLVLHAEVWPGVVERAVKDALARDRGIRDAVQVRELCAWAHEVDRSGRLASLLSTPAGLDDAERAACIGEEGWVLGAP